jgi:hypothetical protein
MGEFLGLKKSALLTVAAGPIADIASSLLQAGAARLIPDKEQKESLRLSAILGYGNLLIYSALGFFFGDFYAMDQLGVPALASLLLLISAPVLLGCVSARGVVNETKQWIALAGQTIAQAVSSLGQKCKNLKPIKQD